MLDFNPSTVTRASAVAAIYYALDNAPAEPERRRDYIGASAIGGACERSVQYEFMGVSPDEGWKLPARTRRIFERGHMIEAAAAKWLQSAGYDLRTRKPDGHPYGFRAANGQFAGHADGVIMSGPGVEKPCLWEHKALGAKSWKAISTHGVEKSKPEYADQIAVYQAYLDLTEPALFMATNMDTMEIHLEFVEFSRARAQAASDRAVAIILDTRAGAMRARGGDKPDGWLCAGCKFNRRCWS